MIDFGLVSMPASGVHSVLYSLSQNTFPMSLARLGVKSVAELSPLLLSCICSSGITSLGTPQL